MDKLKHLDLFSGIGGFSLGLERTGGFKTVAFCEIEPFCQKVLNKHWPDVPVFEDVRSLDYDGSIDIITGGFPCQPFSVAGNQKGKEDDRHLWPAMFSLIKKYRPTWVIGENVAGFINMALDDVLADLESADYQCRAFVIPACAINAPHRRDRVWIVGYTEHNGSSTAKKCREFKETSGNNKKGKEETSKPQRASKSRNNAYVADTRCKPAGGKESGLGRKLKHREKEGFGAEKGDRLANCGENVSGTDSQRPQRRTDTRGSKGCGKKRDKQPAGLYKFNQWEQWSVEPGLGRVANGVSRRVDRLKSLGNAVVPQIPEIIGYAILEGELKHME
jgi:DNA (cytosine-5)-methyltransferase 1